MNPFMSKDGKFLLTCLQEILVVVQTSFFAGFATHLIWLAKFFLCLDGIVSLFFTSQGLRYSQNKSVPSNYYNDIRMVISNFF